MSSLFRKINTSKRETAIKEVLINTLSDNAREIQYIYKENTTNGSLEFNEATTSLCTTLEAIFLNGLKDSFLFMTMKALSNEVERRPEPSFWSPILVFLHKQVIEQIMSLSQINSEIGMCRCWIRLSLNECILSSYLNNIRKNSSTLNPYYKSGAFLKDTENVEMAIKLLQGIESCVEFNLAVNTSLFNQWPNLSLTLAGVWTPALKSCPIASGIDVASSITDVISIPTPKPLQTNEVFSDSISNSPFSRTSNFAAQDLSHHENLEIFLQKVDEMKQIDEEIVKNSEEDEVQIVEETIEIKDTEIEEKETSILQKSISIDEEVQQHTCGNSLNSLMNESWSSNLNDDNKSQNNLDKNSLGRSISMISTISTLKSPVDHYSYNALLKKHENNRVVDWTDVWQRFENSTGLKDVEKSQTSIENDDDDGSEKNDFEVIPFGSQCNRYTIAELQEQVECLCKLAREKGLDSQGFVCKNCAHPIGLGFAPSHVCAFSGEYFCQSCISAEQFMIPAKIIYNWDFRKYSVSNKAATFLTEFQFQPFIDLKLLNPDIYQYSEEMANLQSLRIRLNFVRAYLYTCCQSSIDNLQKQVFSKEYMFEHIHQYSIGDLTMINKGTLASLLQKAVNFGEEHILQCGLCSLKGFICEICNSPKVLYPFHIESTFRCTPCGAVFHPQCLNDSQPCPKCERKRKREDLPLQEALNQL